MKVLFLAICLLFFSLGAAQEPKSYLMGSNALNKAYLEVANKFAEAKTAEEAAQYILDPENVDFKEAFTLYQDERLAVINQSVSISSHRMTQYGILRTKWKSGQKGVMSLIWSTEGDAPKVDWKATYGCGGMPWKKFMEDQPEIGIEMRAIFEPNNYYNFEFSDDAKWDCYSLTHPALDRPLYAYLAKDNKTAVELKEVFKVRADGAITARVAFPQGEKRANQIEILEVLAHTWFDIAE